jgi:Mg2+ and Co2+ transporter CorA
VAVNSIRGEHLPIGTAAPRARDCAFDWIGLHEPDEHQIRTVADVFGLHPLATRGAVETHHRPKLERYDDTVVLVL